MNKDRSCFDAHTGLEVHAARSTLRRARATYHITPAPSQHWIMRALRSCWRWL